MLEEDMWITFHVQKHLMTEVAQLQLYQCLIHGHMEADPEAIYNLCLILKIML